MPVIDLRSGSWQDTLVKDPFYEHMPRYFNMTFKELCASKHPSAWLEFEKGLISQDEFKRKFFTDGRSFDFEGLTAVMVRSCG